MTAELPQGGFSQLASALQTAGLVSDADAATQATAEERSAIIADVRRWLARVCAGERVSSRAMSPKLDVNRASRVQVRLRDAGFVTTSHGNHGGAEATPLLLEHARTDVSDAWIVEIVWPAMGAPKVAPVAEDDRSGEARAPAGAGGARTQDDSPPRGPRVAWGPPPRTQAAREAGLVKHLRAWLTQAAAGEPVRASRISNCAGQGLLAQIAGRLRDAGLLAVHGPTGNRWFGGTETLAAQWPLSDEQLAAFVWPRRAAGEAPPPAKDWETNETDEPVPDSEKTPAVETAQDPLDLLATRMLDFLHVLENLHTIAQKIDRRVARVDERMQRLEKVWDLPPLEGDAL